MSNKRHVTRFVRALAQITLLAITFTSMTVGCGGELVGGTPQPSSIGVKSRNVQVVGSLTANGRIEYLVLPMMSGARMTVARARAVGQRASSIVELTALLDRLPDGSTVYVANAAQFVGPAGQLRTLPHEITEQLGVVRLGVAIVDTRADGDDIGTQTHALAAGAVGWGRGGNSRGNCYRYAAGDKMKGSLATDPREHFESPGDLPGSGKNGCPTCADMMKGAKADGMSEPDAKGDCPKEHYKVCVLIATDPNNCDFHWARENGDGTWSHKPGALSISDRDASDKKITDPAKADWNFGDKNYDKLCGCLCVPNAGIDVDANDGGGNAVDVGVVVGVELR